MKEAAAKTDNTKKKPRTIVKEAIEADFKRRTSLMEEALKVEGDYVKEGYLAGRPYSQSMEYGATGVTLALIDDMEMKSNADKGTLSPEEYEVLNDIRNRDEYVLIVSKIYNLFVAVSGNIRAARKEYLLKTDKITELLKLYESFSSTAKLMGETFDNIRYSINGKAVDMGEKEPFELMITEDGRTYDGRQQGVEDVAKASIYPGGRVEIDIEGEGRLKDLLNYQAKRAEIALKELKILLESVITFIEKSKLPLLCFMPYGLEKLIVDKDYIPLRDEKKWKKYFKSYLKKKKAHGREVTPEEWEFAYYPEYNDIKLKGDYDNDIDFFASEFGVIEGSFEIFKSDLKKGVLIKEYQDLWQKIKAQK